MKSIRKYPFVSTFLPKLDCYTAGGRHAAIYHFYGSVQDLCKSDCEDCLETIEMLEELYEVDDGFRREWQKLSARYARVPQRHYQRAEYRRKRGKNF